MRPRRPLVPAPCVFKGLDLRGGSGAVLLSKEHVVFLVGVEGWVQVDEVNTLVFYVLPQDLQVVTIIKSVHVRGDYTSDCKWAVVIATTIYRPVYLETSENFVYPATDIAQKWTYFGLLVGSSIRRRYLTSFTRLCNAFAFVGSVADARCRPFWALYLRPQVEISGISAVKVIKLRLPRRNLLPEGKISTCSAVSC
jgi:hypothetical protein